MLQLGVILSKQGIQVGVRENKINGGREQGGSRGALYPPKPEVSVGDCGIQNASILGKREFFSLAKSCKDQKGADLVTEREKTRTVFSFDARETQKCRK